MDALLRFNDLACLDQSNMGVGSAGLAVLARAGFPTVRGIVITPKVFSDFLKKDKIAKALAKYRSGDVDDAENREFLKVIFTEERIPWGHEMDLINGFRELDGSVSLVTTTSTGSDAYPFYADREEEFLRAVKDCWLGWMLSETSPTDNDVMPAVIVREFVEAEVSVELCKRKNDIHIRAIFGLPEGLVDPAVSPDLYEFDAAGELSRIEQRKQEWQYAFGRHGLTRIEVAPEFQGEEKVSGKMLKALDNLMANIHDNQKLACCVVCFVADKPVIYSSDLIPETPDVILTLPHREDSLSLMDLPKPTLTSLDGPVIATKLFLKVDNEEDIGLVADTYVEGLLISKKFIKRNVDWAEKLIDIAKEARRRFSTSGVAVEVPDSDIEELVVFGSHAQTLVESGMEISLLLPGSRSMKELRKIVSAARLHWKGPPTKIWLQIKYPSNLFFMDTLAEHSDFIAVDLESFIRFMLGVSDEGVEEWMDFSLPVLRNAYSEMLMSASTLERKVVALSPDLVGSPSLLEFLVKEGIEILCVKPEELHTVRHIVASIEKRILLERGMK
jgi:phosphoenolpyruvate synthase/pyruvate phosphate dikinase